VSEQFLNGTSSQCEIPLKAEENIYGNVVSLDVAQYKVIPWLMMDVDNSRLLD